VAARPSARPLWRSEDHGAPICIDARELGLQQTGERWIGPFLDANRPALARLQLRPRVEAQRGVRLLLEPGARIGAAPVLHPASRRVVAGVLVTPRVRWPHLGAVLDRLGFAVEPTVGGLPAVPGSAREVPAWVLAGPVLSRLEASLARIRRGFVERTEERRAPRGRVDWQAYATRSVPSGAWDRLRCTFPEPDRDPEFTAAARWTVDRLADALAPFAAEPIGRRLAQRAHLLAAALGQGPARRPSHGAVAPGISAFVAHALEAMGWVAEERGLGGARTLDGLAWDLDIDVVWEQWVGAFAVDVAQQLGLAPATTAHALRWSGVASMGSLRPDAVLRGPDRAVVIDAKYKRHLELLRRTGWRAAGDELRESHRADLHQVLAYAALQPERRVDAVLAYPWQHDRAHEPPRGVARLAVGDRRVRVVLAGLPFGFDGPDQRDRTIAAWRAMLAAGEI
jgi:hypothetical protein